MADAAPPRAPLEVRTSYDHDGSSSDGVEIWTPDHPKYDDEYTRVVRDFQRFGIPIPYASQALIDLLSAEQDAPAAG